MTTVSASQPALTSLAHLLPELATMSQLATYLIVFSFVVLDMEYIFPSHLVMIQMKIYVPNKTDLRLPRSAKCHVMMTSTSCHYR